MAVAQQQWGGWNNAVWNMVFVGCENTPGNTFPDPPYTVVDRTPVIREKPYLYVDQSGEYSVFVPALQTNGKEYVGQRPDTRHIGSAR